MSDATLTTLLDKGVEFFWDGIDLKVRARKGLVSTRERDWIKRNKDLIASRLQAQKEHNYDANDSPGRRLLDSLWDAAYRIQLVKSDSNPTRFMIIPIGPITPSQELLAEYEAHHDAAVRELVEACTVGGIDPLRWHEAVDLLIETCRRVGIAPEHWHRWVEKIAANSQKVLTEFGKAKLWFILDTAKHVSVTSSTISERS